MPLPEVAGWGGRRGCAPSLQPSQSAHMICGQGGLVTSKALCTVESESSHAAIPCCSPSSRGAVSGGKEQFVWVSGNQDFLAALLREDYNGIFYKIYYLQNLLFCIVLNFSTLYLLLLFLCFLQTCLTHHRSIWSLAPDLWSVCKTEMILPITS